MLTVRQIFFDCTKCICSLLYRALNVIASVTGSWSERHCRRSWKIAKDLYECIPRGVMPVDEITGRKAAVTQSKDRVCGPLFVQYEREYSLLQEEYCLHEPVQLAHDNNADYHTHKVKSRTVG